MLKVRLWQAKHGALSFLLPFFSTACSRCTGIAKWFYESLSWFIGYLSLVVVFFLGLEYQEYNRMKHTLRLFSYGSISTFLFSTDQSIPSEQLAVNSLKIRNGMILKVNDAYYEVQFNPEFSTYTITRVYKVSPTDRIMMSRMYYHKEDHIWQKLWPSMGWSLPNSP